jgi:hypothetical protein
MDVDPGRGGGRKGALDERITVGAWAEAADRSAPSHVEIANLLLAALVLSQAVYHAARLVLYRRGVHG